MRTVSLITTLLLLTLTPGCDNLNDMPDNLQTTVELAEIALKQGNPNRTIALLDHLPDTLPPDHPLLPRIKTLLLTALLTRAELDAPHMALLLLNLNHHLDSIAVSHTTFSCNTPNGILRLSDIPGYQAIPRARNTIKRVMELTTNDSLPPEKNFLALKLLSRSIAFSAQALLRIDQTTTRDTSALRIVNIGYTSPVLLLCTTTKNLPAIRDSLQKSIADLVEALRLLQVREDSLGTPLPGAPIYSLNRLMETFSFAIR